MPTACCITLRVFQGTACINGSLNTNGLVIAEVYREPGTSVNSTVCGQYT